MNKPTREETASSIIKLLQDRITEADNQLSELDRKRKLIEQRKSNAIGELVSFAHSLNKDLTNAI